MLRVLCPTTRAQAAGLMDPAVFLFSSFRKPALAANTP